MLARSYCNHCGKRELECRLEPVMTAAATWGSPSEWESWCRDCVDRARFEAENEAYERANRRYKELTGSEL